MGHIVTKTNQYVKYEGSVIKCLQDNERNHTEISTV